ncbi:oligo-1,6-glucosidase [Alkalihalophilus pseudofirmus OF4]|uniref:oligo-1,6-glucosidase n=1 Tax=Alkalihalophilus pseudofirmus (strain ATCC BAA-2126 / JCM 17055 / OF4) TaxID=398511 RepID=D3FYW2_ALKPO|nr:MULTISPECIES: alpha-glucosidase [Alkalihalophilus]ADC48995.1 oligo-1,6-glucosidase [Alkalihalophilus pseudofirmus OF4]MED1600104.1 alpha-glucosidase [Alkalihalophilus marmarensis]
MDKQWWKESVVYQIYPRSFYDSNGDGIGDIKGIISKLDYLTELGINVVWLSPVYESPNDDNGYDISDYKAIMDDFGTMEDWDQLLDEMHKRGIKLVMDLVVNHTSDEHHWFAESRSSKDNPYRDYYIWRPGKGDEPPTDWIASFGGSAWEYDKKTDEYFLHMFSRKQPDLNWENEQVRQDVYEMMRFWLDKGVDGFRMDVINMISKKEILPSCDAYQKGDAEAEAYQFNLPGVHDYLREMNEEVLSKYDIMTVGECPKVTPEEAIKYTAVERQELNMVFQFEHMGLDKHKGRPKWELKELELRDLKNNLSKWQEELANSGWNSLYWSNHDQPRTVSRFGDDTHYHRESATMLATLLHMMKGTPYIYQGEEIGMTNIHFDSIEDYRDIETLNHYREMVEEKGMRPVDIMPAIYVKSRDNARTPMQWSAEEKAGFTTGTPWIDVNPNYQNINVEQALEDKDSIFHYYKKLIQLRRQHEVIVYGKYQLLDADHPSVFAYERELNGDQLIVICNFYGEETTFDLGNRKAAEVVISNYANELPASDEIKLRPYEAIVYRLDNNSRM